MKTPDTKAKLLNNIRWDINQRELQMQFANPRFLSTLFSLSKHLSSKKGSRTSNCGNCLEFSVLTLLTSVPWLPYTPTVPSVLYPLYPVTNSNRTKWSIRIVHPARPFRPSIWVRCAVILLPVASTRYLAVRLTVCCATHGSRWITAAAQEWAVSRPTSTTTWSAIIGNSSTICTSAKPGG